MHMDIVNTNTSIHQTFASQLLLKWNLMKCFQELEFTGVMRFYYQAQDMDSGQKVGFSLLFPS